MDREPHSRRSEGLRPETLAVALGRGERDPGAPLNPPVVFSATYHAGGPVAYGRTGNPSWTAFEELIGGLEGGRALSFASGMAAINAILEGVPAGRRVVVSDGSYFETRSLMAQRAALGRFAVEPVDITDTQATLARCRGAHILWAETPTNPLLGIADIAALTAGAHQLGATVVVDNTFATPLLQAPLALGADAVVHSATKFLAGHSDVVLGAVVTRNDELHERLFEERKLAGAVAAPMEAFLTVRGIRTLAVRLERGQASAGELARRLADHPGVSIVRYPGLPGHPGHDLAARQMRGFGAILSFDVRGDAAAAERVAGAVRVITHATSLGGVESLLERRSRWPGETAPPSLLRMSVGCEHVEDLWSDLDRALGTA